MSARNASRSSFVIASDIVVLPAGTLHRPTPRRAAAASECEPAGIFPRFCRHTFRSPRPRLIVDRRTIADSRVHPPAVVVRDIAAHLPLELVLVREADAVDDVALHRVKE